jgi:glutaredoxin-like YruB-family protein
MEIRAQFAMLAAIRQAKIMRQIKLYSRPLCGWCQEAKAYLKAHNLPFEEVDVGRDRAAFEEMVKLSGQTLVPTIVVDGHVLADFDVGQLEKFLAKLN